MQTKPKLPTQVMVDTQPMILTNQIPSHPPSLCPPSKKRVKIKLKVIKIAPKIQIKKTPRKQHKGIYRTVSFSKSTTLLILIRCSSQLSNHLSLTNELEPLAPLFMSQHKALTNPIKNLVTANLTLMKTLEKKKESSQSLHDNKKIPKSLCIKCELTTPPSYSAHPDFLKLKDDLKQEVSTFIANGTPCRMG